MSFRVSKAQIAFAALALSSVLGLGLSASQTERLEHNGKLTLGAPLGDLAITDFSGKVASITGAGPKGMTAVMFFADPDTNCAADLRALMSVKTQLAELKIRVLGVASTALQAAGACAEASQSKPLLMGSVELFQRLGVGGARSEVAAVLLDQEGVVRRLVRASEATDLARRLVDDVKAWQGGKQIYDAQCARCHGADGRDTGYPYIKSLGGIGNRISEAEILERTAATGVVDMTRMSKRERHELAVYVAGL